MSDIKRYTLAIGFDDTDSIDTAYPKIKESINGELVKHTSLQQACINAIQEFVDKELPRINAEGLDENEHCCESVLYHERERIHRAVKQLKEQGE